MNKVRLSLLLFVFCLFPAFTVFSEIERGVGNYPKTIDGPGFTDAFEKASKSGAYVMHHLQLKWTSLTGKNPVSEFTDYQWMRYLIENKYPGLELVLHLDITPSSDRKEIINLPHRYRNAKFSHPDLRRAYLQEVNWLADHFKPAYFLLGVEVEGYYVGHPEDFQNFVSLYKETYHLIKKTHPQMKIAVYFQYEGMQGLWKQFVKHQNPQLNDLFFLINQFMPELDFAAFSTYPEAFFAQPSQIPQDYYEKISKYTALPVMFAEIGWSSKYGPLGTVTQSNQTQAEFIRIFADRIQKLNVQTLIWYFLHDMDDEQAFRQMPKWWSTMGLLDGKGNPKPSWAAWNDSKTWHRQTGSTSIPPREPLLKGDLNLDHHVNRTDFGIFLKCMKQKKVTGDVCARADFDSDNNVDLGDFLKFGDYMKKARAANR